MKKNILDTVHESVKGLHDAGLIDPTTMRKFDSLCLIPAKKLTKSDVKKIRLSVKVSQPVFAQYLNVSPSTVKQWETGEKHPSGASLRLLQLVGNSGLELFNSIRS